MSFFLVSFVAVGLFAVELRNGKRSLTVREGLHD
jgi:hypothetical protein